MTPPSTSLEAMLTTLRSDRETAALRGRDFYLDLVDAPSRPLAALILDTALAKTARPAPEDDERTTFAALSETRVDHAAPSEPDDVTLRIGDFEIVRELGRGGMGVVYLARQVSLHRNVALKILPSHFAINGHARLRFRREAETASKIDHPNLCGVLGTGHDAGVEWLAMRFIEGRSLSDLIRHEPDTFQRDWRRGVQLVETLARAIGHAHREGVIHRDLKPANVLIKKDGTPVIVDFGLALDENEESPTLTRSGDIMGTPAYMAPEQIRGQSHAADGRLDVWSLGVILYELTCGHRPFEAASRDALYRSILEDSPKNASGLSRQVPRALDVILETALAKDVTRRYATADDLAEDLRRVREHEPIRARRPGPWTRAWLFAQRRPTLAALLLVLSVGLPAISMLLTRQFFVSRRIEEALLDRLSLVATSLDARDPIRARRFLEGAKLLTPADARITPLFQELALLEWETEAEIVALDGEADPHGLLALSEIARLRNEGHASPRLDLLELSALLRADRQEDAKALAERMAPSEAAVTKEVLLQFVRGDAISSDAEDPDARAALCMAILRSAEGRHDRALHHLARALESNPRAHVLAWMAAEECTRMQEMDAALAFAGRARSLVEDLGPRREARYAVHLSHAGLNEQALSIATNAHRRAETDPVVTLHLANVLAENGERDRAATLLTQLVETSPTWPQAWRALGVLEMDRNHLDLAEHALRRVLALAPDQPDALLDLANVQIRRRQFTDAEATLKTALRRRPFFPFALNSLAVALKGQRRLDDARATVEEALRVRPRWPDAKATLGSILHMQGQLNDAERLYREALALDPKHQVALFNLALLLTDPNAEEAILLYRRVLEVRPNDVAALCNLANLILETHPQDAATLAERATTQDPTDFASWNTLGIARLRADRPLDAVTAFERALMIDPTRVEPYANTMIALEETDPLVALANGVIAQAMSPESKENLSRTTDALLRRLAREENNHLLLRAEKLSRSPDDEEFETLVDEATALSVATPRDLLIRRATLYFLAITAERLGNKKESQDLLREAIPR